MSSTSDFTGEPSLPRIRPPANALAELARPDGSATLPVITYSRYGDLILMHFNSRWDIGQGCMQISDPDWIALDIAQQMMGWMLFNERPAHIVQLGLGAATLTKFCYRHFPDARVTAVELNPAVVDACQAVFQLPADNQRLSVILMDALDFVSNSSNTGQIDVLQVDLYEESADGPALDTAEFYAACAQCLAPQGIMTVNLCGVSIDDIRQRNLDAMRDSFETILFFRTCGSNVVAIAFKSAPIVDVEALAERALCIERCTRLPAGTWLPDMMPACVEQEPRRNVFTAPAT
ncbi:spermidine synthase [Noviherbaspirillum saxi]|nr:spermidine synthase [Noviherbaspirillum saxi]